MKKYILTLGLMFLLVPAVLPAQDSNTGGDVVWVTSIRVQPGDVERFEASVKKIVQAAHEAALQEEFGWGVWTDMFTYHIVGTEKSIAALDGNEERWMKQFEGTPGEATLMAAFKELDGIPQENLGTEVSQVKPEWSYRLDQMSQEPGFAEVCEYAIATGMEEKFDAVYKDYIAILKKLDHPYTHIGHRFIFGSPARHVGVTFYDTKEAFFGKNDVERMAQDAGMGEAWGKLIADFLPTVTGVECSHGKHRPELSYRPEGETSSE